MMMMTLMMMTIVGPWYTYTSTTEHIQYKCMNVIAAADDDSGPLVHIYKYN